MGLVIYYEQFGGWLLTHKRAEVICPMNPMLLTCYVTCYTSKSCSQRSICYVDHDLSLVFCMSCAMHDVKFKTKLFDGNYGAYKTKRQQA